LRRSESSSSNKINDRLYGGVCFLIGSLHLVVGVWELDGLAVEAPIGQSTDALMEENEHEDDANAFSLRQ